jgi:hypothetical protein
LRNNRPSPKQQTTANSPKIFDSKGSAELRINTTAQLPMIKQNGVLLGLGLILDMTGAV